MNGYSIRKLDIGRLHLSLVKNQPLFACTGKHTWDRFFFGRIKGYGWAFTTHSGAWFFNVDWWR